MISNGFDDCFDIEIGKHEIKFKDVYLTDILGIFKYKVKDYTFDFYNLPSYKQYDLENDEEVSRSNLSSFYDASSSDLDDIKNYTLGDLISRINQKLSLKLDTLVVRCNEVLNSFEPLLVIKEYAKTESLTKLLSVALDLINEDVSFYIGIPSIINEQIFLISKEEDVLDVIKEILSNSYRTYDLDKYIDLFSESHRTIII